MKRILRRYNVIDEEDSVKQKGEQLKIRQGQQLSLLGPLTAKINNQLLHLKLSELINLHQEEVFNTFATRCLKPQVQKLQALADVNIERVFAKNANRCIPFTVKDHLKVEGMIETIGFNDNLTPSTYSADIVELLEREGCIAFAHSNIPQGMLGIESGNGLYGITKNPHNIDFISGGSSGGEGALVAVKATAFGVGSDSGGSARIPAAFCGVYAFKPTGSKRFSTRGRVGPSGAEVTSIEFRV